MIDLKNSWDVADTSNRHHVGPVKDQADRVKSHHPVAFAPGLKRGDRRFIVNQPARLSIPGSNAPACEARIRDISHRGMQFAVSQPIQGPRIRIDWNGREIYATVRYLQPDDNGYRLGVEVASAWESLVSDILAQQALTPPRNCSKPWSISRARIDAWPR